MRFALFQYCDDSEKRKEKQKLLLSRQTGTQHCQASVAGTKRLAKACQYVTRPFVVTVVANLMGSFQFGYNIGVASNSQDVIQDFINRTLYQREGSYPSPSFLTNVWALIVASYYLGGALGAVAIRWVSRNRSRKAGLLIAAVVGFVAGGLQFSSRHAQRWELLLVGRFIVGVHVGLYTGFMPMYLSEISPKEIRGAVTSLNPFGIVVALLMSQVLGFPDLLGREETWDILYGFVVVPCLVQLLLLPFCVESPRYLMITLGDKDKAKKALKKLRQSSAVDCEMKYMQDEIDNPVNTVSLREVLRHPPYRRALTLSSVSHLSLQFSGLNGVLVYSNHLFQEAGGLSKSQASYTTSLFGLLSIVVSVVVTPLVETVGRRPLQLTGFMGMAFCLVVATTALVLKHMIHAFGIVSIVFLLLFMGCFNTGPGRIPWVLVGELFVQEVRPIASTVSALCNWLGGFAVAYGFPHLQAVLHDLVFLPFIVFILIVTVYTFRALPETKGKTIQEITALFEHKDDLPVVTPLPVTPVGGQQGGANRNLPNKTTHDSVTSPG